MILPQRQLRTFDRQRRRSSRIGLWSELFIVGFLFGAFFSFFLISSVSNKRTSFLLGRSLSLKPPASRFLSLNSIISFSSSCRRIFKNFLQRRPYLSLNSNSLQLTLGSAQESSLVTVESTVAFSLLSLFQSSHSQAWRCWSHRELKPSFLMPVNKSFFFSIMSLICSHLDNSSVSNLCSWSEAYCTPGVSVVLRPTLCSPWSVAALWPFSSTLSRFSFHSPLSPSFLLEVLMPQVGKNCSAEATIDHPNFQQFNFLLYTQRNAAQHTRKKNGKARIWYH